MLQCRADLLKHKGDTGSLDSETARDKALAEARFKQAQADRLEHALAVERGNFVPREAFEQALAGRAQLFRTDLRNLATGGAGEMVALVDGKPDKIPDLMPSVPPPSWKPRRIRPPCVTSPTPSRLCPGWIGLWRGMRTASWLSGMKGPERTGAHRSGRLDDGRGRPGRGFLV